MTSRPTSTNEPIQLSGGALGDLIFEWKDDRYEHRWTLGDCELASVESSSADLWPSSPPLQQIHQQTFGDGRNVIFGVGMSGRGHWSASFTLIPDLKCWIVELACRAPIAAERLESTYRAGGAWQTEVPGTFSTLAKDVGFELEVITPTSDARVESDRLIIHPVELLAASGTTQWAFRLRAAAGKS